MWTVVIQDEVAGKEPQSELTLDFLTERVTAREIIRSRIYQEVSEFNARRTTEFHGLVHPKKLLQGVLKEPGVPFPRIDWEQQFAVAVESFQRNGFLLLVDDRQITDLDTEVTLKVDTRVSFFKLVPLIGG